MQTAVNSIVPRARQTGAPPSTPWPTPSLRRFSANGEYLGTIFRAGAGPGEYQNVTGMAVLSDDRLVVHDFGNARFNVYSADGRLLDTWTHATDVGEWRPVSTHRGGIYLFDYIRAPGSTEAVPALVRLDERGVAGDTLPIQLVEREPVGLHVRSATQSFGMLVPFQPVAHWTVTPNGDVITADGARYAIDVHQRDGRVVRITRDVDPVAVTLE